MDGHDLRRAPVLAGVDVYLEQRFGSWTVPGGLAALGVAMADRLALRGVTVLTGTHGDRPRRARRPGRGGPDRGRRGRRRPRGRRDRPAAAARPRVVRPAHDACLPAGRVPRGARGRGARPAPRGGAPRRPAAGGAHGWPGAGRCCGVDGAGTRPRRGGRPDGAGAPRPRRPQTGRRPRRPHAGATSSRRGAARRTACSGRVPARPARGWARGRRSPACWPPGRTPPPGRACRSPASAPRWWPRWSAGPHVSRRAPTPP